MLGSFKFDGATTCASVRKKIQKVPFSKKLLRRMLREVFFSIFSYANGARGPHRCPQDFQLGSKCSTLSQ